MKHYRSSIPKEARERVVAMSPVSRRRQKVECTLNGKVVGVRTFHVTGELEDEFPLRNGVTHGIVYRSVTPGKLLSAEPYSNGLAHGTARQWSDDGKLIGTYTMKRGTGIDLWRQVNEAGQVYLSEARYYRDGKLDGFEWWLNRDQKNVHEESHFRGDRRHGIFRQWNLQGRLRRGYPQYFVNGERVTKRRYVRECAKDPTLPPFREEDNRPQRIFPRDLAIKQK